LIEKFNNWRQIFTDGRPCRWIANPDGLATPSEGGTAIGCVESAGFNAKTWLAGSGTPIFCHGQVQTACRYGSDGSPVRERKGRGPPELTSTFFRSLEPLGASQRMALENVGADGVHDAAALIGLDQQTGAFVAPCDELEEQMRPAPLKGQITELVDDQQLGFGVLHEALGELAVRFCLRPARRSPPRFSCLVVVCRFKLRHYGQKTPSCSALDLR
jgi:hypothetical protein